MSDNDKDSDDVGNSTLNAPSPNSLGNPNTPTINDVLTAVLESGNTDSDKEQQFGESFNAHAIDQSMAYAELRGVEDHYKLKKCWSYFVSFIIATMVIFQIILLTNIGRGVWDFSQYEWLLPVVMVQYFVQIIGLAWLIVKSLYRERDVSSKL